MSPEVLAVALVDDQEARVAIWEAFRTLEALSQQYGTPALYVAMTAAEHLYRQYWGSYPPWCNPS